MLRDISCVTCFLLRSLFPLESRFFCGIAGIVYKLWLMLHLETNSANCIKMNLIWLLFPGSPASLFHSQPNVIFILLEFPFLFGNLKTLQLKKYYRAPAVEQYLVIKTSYTFYNMFDNYIFTYTILNIYQWKRKNNDVGYIHIYTRNNVCIYHLANYIIPLNPFFCG